MNVLLISLDTCRADHLACYGYPRPTSPNIDALAGEGTVFWHNISECAHTVPAYTSMFTGQHPTTHGIVGTLWCLPNENTALLDDETPVLAEVLADAGYATAAVDNLTGTMRFHPKWFARGYRWLMNATVGLPRGKVRADRVNEFALPWLDAHAAEGPFYLFLHYWDPHQGYSPPAPFDAAFRGLDGLHAVKLPSGEDFVPCCGMLSRLGEKEQSAVNRYDGEIRYVDDRVGQVLQKFKDLGVYDDTLIVVNGDHGDDMAEHHCNFEHRETYDHTVRVPLIIKPPRGAGFEPVRRVEALTQHMDLMPTILDMAGVEPPAGMDGASLCPLMAGTAEDMRDHVLSSGCWIYANGRWQAAEVAARTREWKLIRRGDVERVLPCERPIIGLFRRDQPELFTALPREQLYDLTSNLYEQVDVSAERPDLCATLGELLSRYTDTGLFIG